MYRGHEQAPASQLASSQPLRTPRAAQRHKSRPPPLTPSQKKEKEKNTPILSPAGSIPQKIACDPPRYQKASTAPSAVPVPHTHIHTARGLRVGCANGGKDGLGTSSFPGRGGCSTA